MIIKNKINEILEKRDYININWENEYDGEVMNYINMNKKGKKYKINNFIYDRKYFISLGDLLLYDLNEIEVVVNNNNMIKLEGIEEEEEKFIINLLE